MDPILILCTSRSRSSLVAGSFAAHGVWCGISGVTHGYATYEDKRVKQLLRHAGKGDWCERLVQPWPPFKERMQGLFPADQPWLIKCSVEFFPVVYDAYPGAKLVYVHREAKYVTNSIMKKRPGTDYEVANRIIQWRYRTMWKLNELYGGVWVHTTHLDDDFWYTLQEAFVHAGIEFDRSLVDDIIQ